MTARPGPLMRLPAAIDAPELPAWRPWALEKGLAVAAALLVLATFRMWTPQTVFPQVPLVSPGRHVPPWAEWLASLVLASSLVMILTAPQAGPRRRAGLIALALAVGWLVMVDGQRLQVWAYQFFWMAWMLALLPPRLAWRMLRWLLVSLYFFSAVAKLDATFLTSMGPYLLGGLFGESVPTWPTWLQATASALLPVGELAVAVGLCFPRTRGTAVAAACAMHGILLVVLGPLGVNHGWGVLVWNAFGMAHVVLLFGGKPVAESASPAAEPCESAEPRRRLALQVALAFPIVFPLLEPLGLCDTWPAWAVYAPRNERTEVYLHPDDYERLPATVRRFVRRTDEAEWLRLRLDQWSLAALAAPVYPQNRLQLGMALAVAQRFRFQHPLRVVQQSTAGRFRGARVETVLTGDELPTATGRYWLNAVPRDNLYGFVR